MSPAPILTKGQFYHRYGTRFGAPGSGAYTRYVGYVNRHRAAAAAAVGPTPTTGYAPGGVTWKPIPPGQRVGPGGAPLPRKPAKGGGKGAGGGGGGAPPRKPPPMSLWQQALMLANKANAPILAQINASYDRQQKNNQAVIDSATHNYMAAVAQYAPQSAAAYQQAEGAQSSSDAAQAAMLQGTGQTAAANLATELGQAGTSEGAQALQAIGRGSAAASYGKGSADLARLISQGASAANYGAKLPGYAALTGLQSTRSMLRDLSQQRADALGKVTSAAPGTALNLYNQMLSRRMTQRENAANRALQERMAVQSGLISGSKLQLGQATLTERIAHDRAIESNQRASIAERQRAAADRIAAQKALKKKQAVQKQQNLHATAVKNRGVQIVRAQKELLTLAHEAQHPASVTKTVPVLTAAGTPTGKTKTVHEPGPKPTYQQVMRQALTLPEVQPLLRRFAYRPSQVIQILNEYLRQQGYVIPVQASGPYGTGRRGNRPG